MSRFRIRSAANRRAQKFKLILYVMMSMAMLASASRLMAQKGHVPLPPAPSSKATVLVRGALASNPNIATCGLTCNHPSDLGASVYLFSFASSSTGEQAISILTDDGSGVVQTDDFGNSYILSDTQGNFDITGLYAANCPTSTAPIYMLILGGDGGYGMNPVFGEMSAFPVSCSQLPNVTSIAVNELTTLAAAYSLAQFSISPNDDVPNTPGTSESAIANIFAYSNTLVNGLTGAVNSTTPTGQAIPVAEINTLGDIFAACTRSADSSACDDLFEQTAVNPSNPPSDTVQAAFSIAQNPTSNSAGIYDLLTSATPYSPTLDSAPVDWTLNVATQSGPIINSLSPNPASPGANIVLTGSGFGQNQGASTLTLNGNSILVPSWSDTSLGFQLPFDAFSGPVVVTVGNSLSAPYSLTVLTTPATLYQVNPNLLADFSATTILNAITNPAAAVLGIVGDGTSSSIVVYKTKAHADLTLTVDSSSGAKLAAWHPDFQTSTTVYPSPTCSSQPSTVFCIPAVELIPDPAVQDGYYALALLQAPAPATPSGYAALQISVTASQTNVPCNYCVSTVAVVNRPVILIHGLWGDESSFSNITNYLGAAAASYIDYTSLSSTLLPEDGSGRLSPMIRVCYSKMQPFDAPTGTLYATEVCPSVAGDAVNSAINNIYQYLDDEGVVGGRVDVVAHSMGGLVARYVATTPSFHGLRDFGLGKFYSVLTLDTPQLGSALADYLVQKAPSLYLGNDSLPQEAIDIWTAKCDESDTLASCYGGLGNPISIPGDSTYTLGAVGSLQTTYGGYGRSSGANPYPLAIPNVFQTSVSSLQDETPSYACCFHSQFLMETDPNTYVNGVPEQSVLRAVTQTFIDAVDPDAYQGVEVSPSSLLGFSGDDGIVTVASQQAGTDPTQPVSEVAHSAVGFISATYASFVLNRDFYSAGPPATQSILLLNRVFSAYNITYTDRNVMDYAPVNAAILCWLSAVTQCPNYAGSAIPSTIASSAYMQGSFISQASSGDPVVHLGRPAQSGTAPAAAPSSDVKRKTSTTVMTDEERAQAQKRVHTYSKRPTTDNSLVDIIMPSEALRLNETFNLSMKIKGEKPRKVFVGQWSNRTGSAEHIAGGDQTLDVRFHENGEMYISVVPVRLGTVDFMIYGIFPSGGVFHKTVKLYVEPSGKKPQKLLVASILRTSMEKPQRVKLIPRAVFGETASLELDPHFVTYKIYASGGREVISLDPRTGYFVPVRVGHALVDISYEGATVSSCIVVSAGEIESQRDHSHCEELGGGKRTTR